MSKLKSVKIDEETYETIKKISENSFLKHSTVIKLAVRDFAKNFNSKVDVD